MFACYHSSERYAPEPKEKYKITKKVVTFGRNKMVDRARRTMFENLMNEGISNLMKFVKNPAKSAKVAVTTLK